MSAEWIEFAEGTGLWTANYRVPGLPCRSAAVRLSDGKFALFSPGASVCESFRREFDGEVAYLIAPSSFHWLGISTWLEAFPRALVAAGASAKERLAKKGVLVAAFLDEVRKRLPSHVELLEVPGTRIGELWLRVETSRGVAWVVCDAFFNFERIGAKFHQRLWARLAKSGPGIAISSVMKWGGVRDRARYGAWLRGQLRKDQPRFLVPNHGSIVEGDALSADLEALIDRRL